MKKTLAIFAILLMAFSSLAFAEGEEAAPPTEPTPPPAEPTPPSEPTPPTEPQPPTGEQPVPPPVPGEPGTGGMPPQPGMCYFDGKEVPCDQMPRPDQQPPQPGPGRGGCWVGDKQVPCPGEGQQYEGNQPFVRAPNMPEGCKEVRDANGMFRVDCAGQQRAPEQMTCTPGPERERIEQKCKEQGGRIITKNVDPSKGCGIVDCVFGQQGGGNFMPGQEMNCPGPDELMQKEESCRSMGLNPVRMRSSCEYVQCEDPNKQRMECPDNRDEWERAGMECSNQGGRVVKAFNENGCNIPKCVVGGEQCPNNVPQEAYFKCEDQGGKLVINTDEDGCITFSKCVKRGEEGVEAEDKLEEVPPAAKLLQVALKLESIKISFDQMAKQISAIADYYENEGDDANAERFRTASGMFESAKKQIDGVKEELKMGVKGMSVEQIIDIKHKIRQISDVVMEDALYVILGGESTGTATFSDETAVSEEAIPFMPAATNDCGSNGNCFGKALRICQADVSFSPDSSTNIKILGLEEGVCLIKGITQTPIGEMKMECKFQDYATEMFNKENFMNYCQGEMVDFFMKMGGDAKQASEMQAPAASSEERFNQEMMGCEKVDKGINKGGVCGNECCEERFGESYYSCPQDCMARQAEKQPFVEKAQQVFRQGDMGGCADVANGLKPKDVCGNGCCEPNEAGNCLQDCNAMQRPPMNDEGQFFNQQRGPMQPGGQEGEQGMNPDRRVYGAQKQGIKEIPREEWLPPQEPANPPPYAEPAPLQGERGGGGESNSPSAESSSGGGGGMVAGAFVAIDLLKDFLGR